MKSKMFSFCGIFAMVILLKQSNCQQKASAQDPIFQLKEGNQWIYVDSAYEDGKLISVMQDTVRIMKVSASENKSTYVFSDGKEMVIHGDTLFQLVSQRSGVKFPTPVFIRTNSEVTFNYAFGGDVMMERNVTRLKECPKNKWNAPSCYKITDSCHGEAVFASGIGMVREKFTGCSGETGNFRSRTLMSTNF